MNLKKDLTWVLWKTRGLDHSNHENGVVKILLLLRPLTVMG